jgi:hypothetical protein
MITAIVHDLFDEEMDQILVACNLSTGSSPMLIQGQGGKVASRQSSARVPRRPAQQLAADRRFALGSGARLRARISAVQPWASRNSRPRSSPIRGPARRTSGGSAAFTSVNGVRSLSAGGPNRPRRSGCARRCLDFFPGDRLSPSCSSRFRDAGQGSHIYESTTCGENARSSAGVLARQFNQDYATGSSGRGEITKVQFLDPSDRPLPEIRYLFWMFDFWPNEVEIFDDGDAVIQSFVISDTRQAELASRTLGHIVHAIGRFQHSRVNRGSIVHDMKHLAHDKSIFHAAVAEAATHGLITNIMRLVPPACVSLVWVRRSERPAPERSLHSGNCFSAGDRTQ